MQVSKKINIKNWNNEECQGGGALEKLLDIILDFADEHPVILSVVVPILVSAIASFVTTLIILS